ncbi:MmgE/PrpD family protein [Caproiciproducens sp. NJN-50]|uniref:MmgE/PrpD family protein n=1 Tax=Caproiciproducens sp. NJN-50 TaxID=2507162 RepID=UPI000FFE1430|nr:MmgE/PrpD family protein [Caproiciproducens sp. NJN-50]QAT49460.1 MmgE/PrpD family protein [Caproiciproducens sp. NJN-50]
MSTKALADFACDLSYQDLPDEAVDAAKMCLLDILGVAVAGSVTQQGKKWTEYFTRNSSGKEATVWDKHLKKLSCDDAAALNAAHGHLLDLDDVHTSSITHLGVVTIPTAIAIGQREKSSGKDVLAAIAAGYEVGARIGEAINPSSYRFWHTTAVVGTFSSCTAAAKLLGLTHTEFLNSFGSAGTQSAGLWEFLEDGAMSKALHTANAALCGIRSAELAKLGITGASRILEGERGLIRAIAPRHDMDTLVRGLGDGHYKILSNSLKPYACCRHIHSAIYGIQKLSKLYQLSPQNILHITDKTYSVAKLTADRPHPASAYACKFSIQYCIAAAILYHTVSQSVFSEEKINQPEIRKLMDSIEVVEDPTMESKYEHDGNQWGHRLEITLKDGTTCAEEIIYPIGDFNNPFDWHMAESKFSSLTDGILSHEQSVKSLEKIRNLDRLNDINELFE